MDERLIEKAYRILAEFYEQRGEADNWAFESLLFSRPPLRLGVTERDALAQELVRRKEAENWVGGYSLSGSAGERQFQLTGKGQAHLKRYLTLH